MHTIYCARIRGVVANLVFEIRFETYSLINLKIIFYRFPIFAYYNTCISYFSAPRHHRTLIVNHILHYAYIIIIYQYMHNYITYIPAITTIFKTAFSWKLIIQISWYLCCVFNFSRTFNQFIAIRYIVAVGRWRFFRPLHLPQFFWYRSQKF